MNSLNTTSTTSRKSTTSNTQPIRAVIIGANGYGGVELLRLLSQHAQVQIVSVVSRREAGKPISAVFPQFYDQLIDHDGQPLCFSAMEAVDWAGVDVCFFATPHGVAMRQAQTLLDKGIKVIDLSADFRLKNQSQWAHWYKETHTAPELIAQAVYGLPELNREALKTATLIACPGCYPTAIQLGLMPLLKTNRLLQTPIIIDAKSGVSGAGRSANTAMLMAERSENFSAYAANGHRHLPEIEQQLSIMAGQPDKPVSVIFTPHLLPIHRGIHATLYAQYQKAPEDIHNVLSQAYAHEPFVSVLPIGHHPETRAVRGTNQVQIAVAYPPNTDYVTLLVVIDNLVKGAAGQAIQCMNLCFGLPETTGLRGIIAI
ncbi:N-acetyl-gamma-glutamyl-phosphate reductase [Ostreibacterium oceani]|uniref:N-acetyl-gamma-glutamyl-phosphate reductase n=1 Tax=Ostreibacterium oceani TaxID=2654998 RepID=A0A6N7EY17_9GAMM|nr:N-acetyl-gamma-glutamyl-phosphate reductase [Ostreibacterium oceani]MPV86440.1 N-acetyl-gamma-glutamyl-phosphate reductase [Ostreibacterium oceani]